MTFASLDDYLEASALWKEGKVNTCTAIAKKFGMNKNQFMSIVGAHRDDFPARNSRPGIAAALREVSSAPKPRPAFKAPPALASQSPPVRPGHRCLYPTGDSPRIRFECEAPTVPGYPYCEAHCRLCYDHFDRRQSA